MAATSVEQKVEAERPIVIFVSIPDKVYCKECYGVMELVISEYGLLPTPPQTGFAEYVHPLSHSGCPHAGKRYLMELPTLKGQEMEKSAKPGG